MRTWAALPFDEANCMQSRRSDSIAAVRERFLLNPRADRSPSSYLDS